MKRNYVSKMSGILNNPKKVLNTKQDKMNEVTNVTELWNSVSGGEF